VTNDSPVLEDPTVLKELEEMKKKGIEIGISTSGPDQEITIEKFLKINEKTKLFSFLQTTINIFDQSCTAILKNASEKKINIIAKEIFSNGRLTNANKKFHQNELIELASIAKSVDLSLEELSYLWVYQLPFVKICLTGASTISQLENNLKCLRKKDIRLPNLKSFSLDTQEYWSIRKSLNWN
jgi:aryl-alcohol dehydrogenase-like predicted oxidoreductase